MDSRKLQVVLVDDNEDDRAFFRSALAESSLEVDLFEANGGVAALNYLVDKKPDSNLSKRGAPDLIFLDLNMPGMDGFAVIKKIRAKLGYQNIPIIVLTSSASDSDRTTAYALGASAFHKKPWHYQELRTLVQSVIALWGNGH